MTKVDKDTLNSSRPITNPVSIRRLLPKILEEAMDSGKIVSGLYQVAKVLERNSGKAAACIMAKDGLVDPGSKVLHLLLETFCRENFIPIVKVNNLCKLARLANLKNCIDMSEDEIGCLLLQKYTTTGANNNLAVLTKICNDNIKQGKQLSIDLR